MLCMHGKIMVN